MLLRCFRKDYREASLRAFFALVFISVILGISMNKILIAFGIRKSEPLVTLQINYSTDIPVWPSFICGQGFTGAAAQTLKRGKPDVATYLPQNLIQRFTTDNLTTGDWTNQSGSWPCFIFNPGNNMFFKPGEIDQIILLGLVSSQVAQTQSGLLFGIFNDERNLTSVNPFVAPTPSVNTFTFTSYERTDVNNFHHSYFFVNQQNTVEMPGGFAEPTLGAKFAYSPDTYLVQKYTEKVQYTPYDLISNVGGLITYALAIWFILFGRGKYRSWGLIQRYVLRNSPDARKRDNSNSLLPFTVEKPHDRENNSTLVGSKINFDDDERPPSAFYFSSSGTPTQSRFTSSLSPNSIITPSSQFSGKELNKRIDAKINQKLWFVEQTLSRHYLSGFKLRRYDVDLKKLGFDTSYDDNEKETLTPPTINQSWNNLDSNVQNNNQNNHRSIQIPSSLSPGNKTLALGNKSSRDTLNPEEQRSQYPNVAIGQVPLEKKQRGRNSGTGSGNYQQFVNTNNNASTNVSTDVNTSTTTGVGIAPSSFYSQISQSDNLNNTNNLNNVNSNSITLSQFEIPPSLRSGFINNQEQIQVQAPPQGSAPQGGAPQGGTPQGGAP